MKIWIDQVGRNIANQAAHSTFINEFVRINIHPDHQIIKNCKPTRDEDWTHPEFLNRVWIEVISAHSTVFKYQPNFTYEKVWQNDISIPLVAANTLDKLFLQMLHEEQVELQITSHACFTEWCLFEGLVRHMQKNNLQMEFSVLYFSHVSESIYHAHNMVQEWRPVFRKFKVSYNFFFESTGRTLITPCILQQLGII